MAGHFRKQFPTSGISFERIYPPEKHAEINQSEFDNAVACDISLMSWLVRYIMTHIPIFQAFSRKRFLLKLKLYSMYFSVVFIAYRLKNKAMLLFQYGYSFSSEEETFSLSGSRISFKSFINRHILFRSFIRQTKSTSILYWSLCSRRSSAGIRTMNLWHGSRVIYS